MLLNLNLNSDNMKKLIFTFFALWIFVSRLFAQLPVCVKDINAAGGDSYPLDFCVFNGLLYFTASDGIVRNLYATDGTSAGTVMIKDSIDPSIMVVVNNKLVFDNFYFNGFGLYASDGTAQGTNLIYPGLDLNLSGVSNSYKVWNNLLYFYAQYPSNENCEVWVTDGTDVGTAMLKNIGPGIKNGIHPNIYSNIVEYSNKLYFAANDSIHGMELWSTNGTTAGTQMVKDIRTGTADGFGQYCEMKVYNNKLFFDANNGSSGAELWSTDGTSSGTTLFKDINPGASGSLYALNMYVVTFGIGNSRLLFNANDGVHGVEPWISNGTSAGTNILKDIYPGTKNSFATASFFGKDYLFKFYFRANDSVHGHELWITDGTTGGTNMIKDINPGTENSLPGQFVVYHGKIYFAAIDSTGAKQLWRTDGTLSGTEMVVPSIVTASDPDVEYLLVQNGAVLYYSAEYNTLGKELWKLDIPWYINTSVSPTAGGTATGGGGFHQGDAVNLVATPNANYTFVNWTENSVEVSTLPNYNFNCGAYDRTLVANFQLSVGVDEMNQSAFSISPNPATSELNIYNSGINISKILVYDCSGRMLLNVEKPLQNNGNIVIDISKLQRGLYYINISGEDFNNTQKFVKL